MSAPPLRPPPPLPACCTWEPPASRCFDVEVSADEEQLRCGVPRCACGAPWQPNTVKNADALARHVAEATDARVAALAGRPPGYNTTRNSNNNDTPLISERTALVVAVLELDDSRCTLGMWLPQMLSVMFPGHVVIVTDLNSPATATSGSSEPSTDKDNSNGEIVVVVRRFLSRRDLLERAVLGELHPRLAARHAGRRGRLDSVWPPVLVVLSTHASTQGQVFACTPHALVAAAGVEEFCALHDFVVTCQHALGRRLCGVYVSACFVMRLGPVHAAWPVPAAWLAGPALQTALAGPAREVYYTGSQTADVFVVGAVAARALKRAALVAAADAQRGSTRRVPARDVALDDALPSLVVAAQTALFPDLCTEMGLTVLAPPRGTVAQTLAAAARAAVAELTATARDSALTEEPVTHPARVIVSALAAVLVAPDGEAARLAAAIAANARARPDVRVFVETASPATLDAAVARLRARPDAAHLRIFVVFLGTLSRAAIDTLAALDLPPCVPPTTSGGSGCWEGFYGILCVTLSSANNNKDDGEEEQDGGGQEEEEMMLKRLSEVNERRLHASVAAMRLSARRPELCVPLLLYLVHLALGENGVPEGALLHRGFAPAYLPAPRAWELPDVLRECRTVCPGLAAASQLRLVASTCLDVAAFTDLSAPLPPPPREAHQPVPDGVLIKAPRASPSVPTPSPPSKRARAGSHSNKDDNESKDNEPEERPAKLTAEAAIFAGVQERNEARARREGASAEAAAAAAEAEAAAAAVMHVGDGVHPVRSPEYHGNDLPLSANMDEVLMPYMDLKMYFDFDRRVVHCVATFTLEPAPAPAAQPDNGTATGTTEARQLPKILILDCCDLDVYGVRDADTGEPLRFQLDAVRLCVHAAAGAAGLPRRVAVEYATLGRCRSVLFAPDADGRPCCFTCGSPMNNRSWLPGADCERTLLRYDAEVSVPDGAVAVWSAPRAGPPSLVCAPGAPCRTLYRFRMDYALPPSTIAFAVGWFAQADVPGMPAALPATLSAPRSLLARLQHEYGRVLPRLVRLLVDALGAFPFARCDVAVMPPCLGALGWQNPNVTFLSHTLLPGDGSMAIRFVHELVHNYFGLLFSESDWYEVWLSEGFTEYVSERLYYRALALPPDEQEHRIRLASLHRYRVLINDINNTDEFFHQLSSSSHRDDSSSESSSSGTSSSEIKKEQQ